MILDFSMLLSLVLTTVCVNTAAARIKPVKPLRNWVPVDVNQAKVVHTLSRVNSAAILYSCSLQANNECSCSITYRNAIGVNGKSSACSGKMNVMRDSQGKYCNVYAAPLTGYDESNPFCVVSNKTTVAPPPPSLKLSSKSWLNVSVGNDSIYSLDEFSKEAYVTRCILKSNSCNCKTVYRNATGSLAGNKVAFCSGSSNAFKKNGKSFCSVYVSPLPNLGPSLPYCVMSERKSVSPPAPVNKNPLPAYINVTSIATYEVDKNTFEKYRISCSGNCSCTSTYVNHYGISTKNLIQCKGFMKPLVGKNQRYCPIYLNSSGCVVQSPIVPKTNLSTKANVTTTNEITANLN